VAPQPAEARRQGDRRTAELLGSLSADRYLAVLRTLAGLGTRNSLHPGFDEALTLADGVLSGFGYSTEHVDVSIPGGITNNLIAFREGLNPAASDILVVAHLDSVNVLDDDIDAPAPGADDNASGSAGALELAGVLCSTNWRNNLRIILFGGEEQGLFGSRQYVDSLDVAARDRVDVVINMDMIGRRNGTEPGVLIEGAAVSEQLMRSLADCAAAWTDLAIWTSLDANNSDHVPFIEAGIPAVLTIEADDRANTAVHTPDDGRQLIDVNLALEILRMNLAALTQALVFAD
jgi:Zn-dependent M28 family amino/carboxypeptidase